MKKLIASCSISKRPSKKILIFNITKNSINNYASHFLVFHQLLCHEIMALLLNHTYLKILSLIHHETSHYFHYQTPK